MERQRKYGNSIYTDIVAGVMMFLYLVGPVVILSFFPEAFFLLMFWQMWWSAVTVSLLWLSGFLGWILLVADKIGLGTAFMIQLLLLVIAGMLLLFTFLVI